MRDGIFLFMLETPYLGYRSDCEMVWYIMYCKSLNMCLATVYEKCWHEVINGVTVTVIIVNYYPFQWNSVIPCHFILKFQTHLLQCSLLKRHISGSSYLMSQLSSWHFCFTFSTSTSGFYLKDSCLGWWFLYFSLVHWRKLWHIFTSFHIWICHS